MHTFSLWGSIGKSGTRLKAASVSAYQTLYFFSLMETDVGRWKPHPKRTALLKHHTVPLPHLDKQICLVWSTARHRQVRSSPECEWASVISVTLLLLCSAGNSDAFSEWGSSTSSGEKEIRWETVLSFPYRCIAEFTGQLSFQVFWLTYLI